jgi:hypothetical protein
MALSVGGSDLAAKSLWRRAVGCVRQIVWLYMLGSELWQCAAEGRAGMWQ